MEATVVRAAERIKARALAHLTLTSPRTCSGVYWAVARTAEEWIPDHAASRLSGMTEKKYVGLHLIPAAHATPVATLDDDRRGGVLHQREGAATHVAAVGLDHERFFAAPGLEADAVVEDAAVAAVGGVPHHVARALGLRELLVVRRQVAVAVDGRAEHHARVDLQRGFL